MRPNAPRAPAVTCGLQRFALFQRGTLVRGGIHVLVAIALSILPLLVVGCRSAPAQAPPRHYSVGFLAGGAPQPWMAEFSDELRRLGFVDGQNATIEYRYADGLNARLEPFAEELVALGVDVIVVADTPAAIAASNVTKTVPIVGVSVGDPVGTGLAETIAHPGGNFTGLSGRWPELSGRRLETLRDAVPSLTRVAVLWHPENPSYALDFSETETAGLGQGLEVVSITYRTIEELEAGFDEAVQVEAQGAVVIGGPLLTIHRVRVAQMAADRRLPTIYARGEIVEAGGLLSYSISLADLYRRSATYTEKVLKGTPAGELPIEFPRKFDLIVNVAAARAMDLPVSKSLLERADHIIH